MLLFAPTSSLSLSPVPSIPSSLITLLPFSPQSYRPPSSLASFLKSNCPPFPHPNLSLVYSSQSCVSLSSTTTALFHRLHNPTRALPMHKPYLPCFTLRLDKVFVNEVISKDTSSGTIAIFCTNTSRYESRKCTSQKFQSSKALCSKYQNVFVLLGSETSNSYF